MSALKRLIGISLTALVCASPTASAQPPTDQPAPPSEPEPPAQTRTLDVGDMLRRVLHRDTKPGGTDADTRYIVAAPSIGSKPSTGFSAGFSSNMAFFSGNSTHISSVSAGLKATQKGQVTSGVRLNIFTPDDRWVVQSDNRLQWTSANTYDLGGGSAATDAVNLKYDYFRLNETAYRRVDPGLFVGAGLSVSIHTNVQPGGSLTAIPDQSAYSSYSAANGFALTGQTSAGPSAGVLYDTRDNSINADHGVLANAVYRTYFNGLLGGDSTWQSLDIDVRTYRPLTHDARQKLAFWFLGNLVTGGTAPYFDLPEISFDGRSARGYSEGRYRGQHLLYGEVEYRGALTSNGLLGVVAFLNTTFVDDTTTGQKLFDSPAPGAGFGFRVLLNKRSRTNFYTDWGWGKDGSRGFYLGIQEAF
jgi:outer membrane protein assembly factor BamA